MEHQVIDSLKVNCSTNNLKAIRKFVSDSLLQIKVEEQQVNMIVLAVDEICSNLIIHSNLENENESLTLNIKIEKNDDGLLFEIVDSGLAFDYSTYEEPKIEDIIKEKRRGSIGLMLVRRIMDHIEFISEGDVNICRLFKRIDSKS